MRLILFSTFVVATILGGLPGLYSLSEAAIFRCTDGHYEAGTWASAKFNRNQSQWCTSEPVLGVSDIPEGIYDCEKGATQDKNLPGYYHFKRSKKDGADILTNLSGTTLKPGKGIESVRVTEFASGYTQVYGYTNLMSDAAADQGPRGYGEVRRVSEAIRILKNKQGQFTGLAVEQAKLEYTDPFGWGWTRTAYLKCYLHNMKTH